MIPQVVAWIDPGGMTGLARLWNQGLSFHAAEYNFAAAVAEIERMCQQTGRILAIGYERYTIIPGAPTKDAHTAIEMIGAVKSAAIRHDCVLLPPGKQATPSAEEQRALKQLGWWLPGQKDAQSAAGHMLRWLGRQTGIPPAVAAVLSEAARRV